MQTHPRVEERILLSTCQTLPLQGQRILPFTIEISLTIRIPQFVVPGLWNLFIVHIRSIGRVEVDNERSATSVCTVPDKPVGLT